MVFLKILIDFVICHVLPQLRALTEALQLPIEIFQADAPLITIGDEHKKPPVVLV